MAMKPQAASETSAWRKRSLFVVGTLLLLASLLILLPPVHGATESASAVAPLGCGNGVLDPGETCTSCAADAGVCEPFSVMCGSGNVCLPPAAPCPNVKPCQPVPPSVIADARFVVDSLRPGIVRQAARRVLAALRAMDAYCPGMPSTGQLTLVLSAEPVED